MFACKNCGGNVKYDISAGQLSCEYCHSLFDPYIYEDKTSDAEMSNDFEATIFTCPQCGGEILSTDDTAAGFCSFCGASTVLYSRISNEKKPGYIIPFSKTKDNCKQAYSDFMKKAIFAPNELKDSSFIDGFRGIYMPYWTYYITQNAPLSLAGEKSHRQGDYIITDHFKLCGNLDNYYKGISYDASSSFDDSISANLAPYDVKNMKRFTPAFLSGFYADTADIPASIYEYDAAELAKDNTLSEVKKVPQFRGITIKNLDSITSDGLGTQFKKIDYSMFPVWFMSYRNKDRVAYATVNGQTGKVVADVPISIGKFMLGSLITAIPIYIMLCLFFTMTPGWTLTFVGILSLIASFIYSRELAKIAIKEASAEDKGKLAKENPDMLNELNSKNAAKLSKKLKKKTHASSTAKVFLSVYMCIFGFAIITTLLSNSSNTDGSFILWTIATILSIILSFKSFSRFDKLPGHKGLFGLIFNIIALILASAVVFLQPVSDFWYYGAALVLIASLLVTLVDVILAFNVLSTRKLPQFDTHKGGDDRAYQ